MDPQMGRRCLIRPTQAKYQGKQLIKLLLRTNDTDLQSSRTEVPVRAHVAFGRLEHPDEATAFLHQGPTAAPITRSITITNRFMETMMFYRAEVRLLPPSEFVGRLELTPRTSRLACELKTTFT